MVKLKWCWKILLISPICTHWWFPYVWVEAMPVHFSMFLQRYQLTMVQSMIWMWGQKRKLAHVWDFLHHCQSLSRQREQCKQRGNRGGVHWSHHCIIQRKIQKQCDPGNMDNLTQLITGKKQLMRTFFPWSMIKKQNLKQKSVFKNNVFIRSQQCYSEWVVCPTRTYLHGGQPRCCCILRMLWTKQYTKKHFIT